MRHSAQPLKRKLERWVNKSMKATGNSPVAFSGGQCPAPYFCRSTDLTWTVIGSSRWLCSLSALVEPDTCLAILQVRTAPSGTDFSLDGLTASWCGRWIISTSGSLVRASLGPPLLGGSSSTPSRFSATRCSATRVGGRRSANGALVYASSMCRRCRCAQRKPSREMRLLSCWLRSLWFSNSFAGVTLWRNQRRSICFPRSAGCGVLSRLWLWWRTERGEHCTISSQEVLSFGLSLSGGEGLSNKALNPTGAARPGVNAVALCA